MSSVKQWLSGKQHWLLIIDNADDPALDVSQYFPEGVAGTVLITTRNPQCRQHATAGSCRVDKMSSEDATKLLFKAALLEDTQSEGAKKAASEVVDVLGCLALAIIQAGAVSQFFSQHSPRTLCFCSPFHRLLIPDS